MKNQQTQRAEKEEAKIYSPEELHGVATAQVVIIEEVIQAHLLDDPQQARMLQRNVQEEIVQDRITNFVQQRALPYNTDSHTRMTERPSCLR